MIPLLLVISFLGSRGLNLKAIWYDEWWSVYYAGTSPLYDPIPLAETTNRIISEQCRHRDSETVHRDHLDRMGPNYRCECNCAVPLDAAFCAPDAAGFEHRQYSLCRFKDRIPKLERLLYEQVRARRLLSVRTRRVAGSQSAHDQHLSRCNRHGHLEPG